MKNFKKVTAAIAATLMAATMVAPMAFAAEGDATPVTSFTLTIPTNSGVEAISSVKAYKIFSIKSETSGYTANETSWSCNDVIKNAVLTAIGDTDKTKTPQEALTAISGLSQAEADNLAKAVAAAIEANDKEAAKEDATVTAVTGGTSLTKGEDGKYSFGENAPADGYYIVLATGTRTTGSGENAVVEETESLGMLTVIDGKVDKIGTNGNAKIGLPTVQKKVFEDDEANAITDKATYETNGQWNDVADLEIGQTAKFRLYGTLPSNYDEYDTYKYVFHDTLSKEFATVETKDITVKCYESADAAKAGTSGVTLAVTPTVVKDSTTGVQTITVGWDDLKSLKTSSTGEDETVTETPIVKASSVIVVEYSTKLTDAAVVATTGGQDNKVKLEYSNNPNQTGSGDKDTEETPEDRVIVYTYDLEIDKTFWAGSDLTQKEVEEGTYTDFKFSIDKNVRAVTKDDTDLYGKYDYVVVDDVTETKDMTLSVYEVGGTETEPTYTKVDTSTTDAEGKPNWYDSTKTYSLKIKVKGLDSDEYTVTEDQSERNKDTNTNQKYNDVGAKEVEISSQEMVNGTLTTIYSQNEANFGALAVTLKVDGTEGSEVDIENKAGTQLPSTGGIGTTLFYLGGGAMVALAGVFLITKKRMGKDEA